MNIVNTLNEYAEVVSRPCEKKCEMIFFSYFIFEVKFVIFTDRLNIIEYSSENIK